MSERGIGTKQMADMIGSNMQKVVDRLSESKSANLSIEKLDEFLSKLGYKIVLVPEATECGSDWYEVDSEPTRVEDEAHGLEKCCAKKSKKDKKGG